MNDLQTVEKYLVFLRDLKEIVDAKPNISLADIVAKHKVSKTSTQALQAGGILRKERDKRSARWYWISPVLPNIKMADELINRNNKIQSDYKKARVSKVKGESIAPNGTVHHKTPTKILDVRDVDVKERKTINEVVYELATREKAQTVQYQPTVVDTSAVEKAVVTERANRRVKEVEPKPEREKLFSVLWGVIKLKW